MWKKDDDAVIPRAHIDTQLHADDKFSKLSIERVVEGDSGEYSCEAYNTPGIMVRSIVKINVRGKMSFSFVLWRTIFICIMCQIIHAF